MDEILKHVYNACKPFVPASAEQYLDCARARGGSAFAKEFRSRLALNEGSYLRFLFSGHIGCGKSSELVDLKRQLENSTSPERYFTVYLDANEYLDDANVTPTDILLAIVTELANDLRERIGLEARDGYFKKLAAEIKELLYSEIKISETEVSAAPTFHGVGLGDWKTKIQLLKRDPDARDRVRKKLAPRLSSLREEINAFLDEARLRVKQFRTEPGTAPYKDIVLILDNLEKIHTLEKDTSEESQRELFLERAPQLTGLNTHVIYTVPLRLSIGSAPQLMQRYGSAPVVLPMVKVRRRNKQTYADGIDFLKKLLLLRTAPYPLEKVFDAQALDLLIFYSGGHIRNLMLFVQNACNYVSQAPITVVAAREALKEPMRTYAGMPEHYWTKLAELDMSSTQYMPPDDADYRDMLENLSVLEYNNGDGYAAVVPDDPFELDDEETVSWYAVNPIVTQMRQFKQAKAKLEASSRE